MISKPILFKFIFRVVDFILLPFATVAAAVLKLVRRINLHRLPLVRRALLTIGLLPVRHHYYEPFVSPSDLRHPLTKDRTIVGLDLNVPEQLKLMNEFSYTQELSSLPHSNPGDLRYYYDNDAFKSGDSEYLYSMIRHFKPRRLVEIGSGFSTLIALEAISKNKQEDKSYQCEMICIEPFEHPWLQQVDAIIIRTKVEECDPQIFTQLETNDILFIDSSHVIRPQGDVLYLYLEILGQLAPGVLIHTHDIFSPRDYLEEWVINKFRLWNEQYLLEAYLCFNSKFRVIGALNYLWHNHREEISLHCPVLATEPNREPGSFWIVSNE